MSEEQKENLEAAKIEDDTLEAVAGGLGDEPITVTCPYCGERILGRANSTVACHMCGRPVKIK